MATPLANTLGTHVVVCVGYPRRVRVRFATPCAKLAVVRAQTQYGASPAEHRGDVARHMEVDAGVPCAQRRDALEYALGVVQEVQRARQRKELLPPGAYRQEECEGLPWLPRPWLWLKSRHAENIRSSLHGSRSRGARFLAPAIATCC